jgi:Ca2+/Na+ antiporter
MNQYNDNNNNNNNDNDKKDKHNDNDKKDQHNDNDNNHDRNKLKESWFYLLMLTIWILLGISAYVSAFECTHERYSGGDARKIGMLFMAIILGPFYWLIQPFARASGYCNLK